MMLVAGRKADAAVQRLLLIQERGRDGNRQHAQFASSPTVSQRRSWGVSVLPPEASSLGLLSREGAKEFLESVSG